MLKSLSDGTVLDDKGRLEPVPLARMRNHLPSFSASLRSPRTAKTYASIVGQFLDFLKRLRVVEPARSHVEAFLYRPRQSGRRAGSSTVNPELSALRGFSRHLESHDARALPVESIPFEREPEREPAVMTAGEVRRLFEIVGAEPQAVRRACDLALLAVLMQLGLRIHEAVSLDVDAVDLVSATLLAVRGKGGTRADFPLNAPTLALLEGWLAVRPKLAADGEDALFVSRRGTRLSIRTIERRFVELRTALGTSKKITPHTARHSVATIGLSQGTDVVVISKLLRHARLTTTMRYLHVASAQNRQAVDRLGVLVPQGVLPAPREVPEQRVANDHEPLDDHEGLDDAA